MASTCSFLLPILLFALLSHHISPIRASCSYTSTDGTHFELNSLIKSGQDQYTYTGDNNYVYKINVCGRLPTPCYGMSSSSCKVSEFGTEWANGNNDGAAFSDHPLGPKKGVSINYINGGEPCSGGSRTTTINVECDAAASSAAIHSVSYTGGCNIIINMKASVACPRGGGGGGGGGSGSLSGGWIFTIILLVSAFVYLLGGVVYNNQRNGASGVEMIPNLEFWKDLPGLILDGLRYTKNKVMGLGGYSQL